MTHPRATWPNDNPSPSSGKATGSIVPLSTTAKAVALTNASTQRCPPARLGSVGSVLTRGSIRFPRRPRPSCFSRSGEVPATFGRLTKGVQECLLREAHSYGHLGDREAAVREQPLGSLHATVDHVLVRREPRCCLERAAEVVGAHVGHPRYLRKRQFPGEVVVHVIGGPLERAFGEAA